ncbi:MAG: MATE family efflux transporter [bacterium]
MSFSYKSLITLFKEALSSKEHNFTTGSIRRAVFLLAIPMMLEMLMESIFALVDAYFVSSLGANAIATVGLTESAFTLVYAISIGLGVSATAVVARRIGEKDIKGASEAAVQVIFIGLAVSMIISIVGILYPKELLGLMGGEPDLIEEGYRFTQIMLGGNITVTLIFLINSIFRGAGDASIAMRVLILSNALNILLDPMFIFGFGPIPAFGVEGAAIATTIGRGTAVVFQLLILFVGWSKIKLALKDFVVNITVMWHLIKVSLGGIGQFIIGTSSWVFLMRIMAEFGSEVLAGYTIAIRVILFTMMPAWGICNATATLVGQNLGANKPERAEASVWKASKYNALFLIIASVFYLVFAESILRIFSDEPEVIQNGALCLRIMVSTYVVYAYGMVTIQAFNGAGDTKTPTIINIFCFWLFQLPFAYITAIWLGWESVGVLVAIALTGLLEAIVAIIWFRKGRWKTVKV